MVISFDVVGAIRLGLESYRNHIQNKKIEELQRKLDYTLIKMYYFGQIGGKAVTGYGIHATTEEELNSVEGLSKMDQFNVIRIGKSRGLIMDGHSFDGNQWFLTREGVMYVEALLEEINKK